MISIRGRTRAFATLGLLTAALIATSSIANLGPGGTGAASHREAPAIAGDPQADNTDVYAFVSPDQPETVTIISNFYPGQDPAGGPNFYKFGDDVLYDIKIDNNGDAVEDIIYRFDFTTQTVNPNTFLYNTGPIESLDDENWNVRQGYSITELRGGTATQLPVEGIVPPVNVGPTSTPDYDALAEAAIIDLDNGIRVFAGQRDDPFWADLGGIFDLLTIRQLPGNAGGGVDDLAGTNVQSIAMQIPIELLTADGTVPTGPDAANAVIGVWSTANRFSTTVIGADGSRTGQGDLVQVSRLGMPLVNEVVAPLGAKDLFNASIPSNDAQFLPAVVNPELAGLLNALYNIPVPEGDRDDLVAVFLTGVAGLNQPANVVPSEMLRLNVAIPPADQVNPLGVIAGDNAGFPNGRRLEDEVVDIALRVVAGVLVGDEFNVSPNNELGDGVPTNDVPFLSEFPYVAPPHQGFEHQHHEATGAAPDDGATPAPAETPAAAQTEVAEETPEAAETAAPAETEAADETAAPEETEAADETPAAEETEAAAAESVTVELNELNDSGVSGEATLTADGDSTTVVIAVEGASGDHPVHIHAGTCANLGDVIEPLTDIDADGNSETTVSLGLDELTGGEYSINAHLSSAEIQTYVACGNV